MTFISKVFLFICLLIASPIFSRDIDLDKIYIDESCPIYAKLIDKKIDAYKNAGAAFIDKNVAFAEWLTNREIIYVKEQENINIIYLYDIIRHTRSEITRINGTITYFKTSQAGKFIALKKFTIDSNAITEAQIVLIKLNPVKILFFKSNYLFADFTVSSSGKSILLDKNSGIYEFFPDEEYEKLIIKKSDYNEVISGDAKILAYQSPSGKRCVILSGQAGNYRAVIIGDKRKKVIEDISSATEFFWVDNFNIAYRKGGPGSFRSIIYNLKENSEITLANDSLNTGLVFTNKSKAFSFLKGQLINIFFIENSQIVQTGLEGEDSVLSPDSTRFLSIYNRNLFISNLSIVSKKKIYINKISSEIYRLYNDILKMKNCWKNEFSYFYIQRKLSVYKIFLGK